jgi:CubicO group peptidase (beta-lactamase class C family)
MKRFLPGRSALIFLLAVAFSGGCGNDAIVRPLPETPQQWLAEVRARYGLPGLSGAIIRSGTIEVFQVGARRSDAPGDIAPGDHFHLAGNVKAMTATVIGSLVEDSLLTWNTTLLEAFPELDGIILSIYGNVTVEQFLTHRSGVTEFGTFTDFLNLPVTSGTPQQQREQFTEWLLSRPAVVVPGNIAHSNAGFTVAAAMAERMA